jgi:hypothetical protein
VRLSVLRAGRPLPQRRPLVFIPVRGRVDPKVIVRLEGLGQLKKSNVLIGNRIRDLPACSTVLHRLRYGVHPFPRCQRVLNVKSAIISDLTPSSPANIRRRFGATILMVKKFGVS